MLFNRSLLLAIGVVALFLVAAPAGASVFGEIVLGGGPNFPQGEGLQYTETGGALLLRVTPHFQGRHPIALWADIGISFYEINNRETTISVTDGPSLAVDEHTEENSVQGHIGVQLGSPSRTAFLRPRAGLGIGLYHFWTETRWHNGDLLDPIATQNLDRQTHPGWVGYVGADLFFSRRWGISVEYRYSEVFNLREAPLEAAPYGSSQFHSYTLGVVFAFDTAEEPNKAAPADDPPIGLADIAR
jgi:hypothetical protein